MPEKDPYRGQVIRANPRPATAGAGAAGGGSAAQRAGSRRSRARTLNNKRGPPPTQLRRVVKGARSVGRVNQSQRSVPMSSATLKSKDRRGSRVVTLARKK